jgi:hypothetical protein
MLQQLYIGWLPKEYYDILSLVRVLASEFAVHRPHLPVVTQMQVGQGVWTIEDPLEDLQFS